MFRSPTSKDKKYRPLFDEAGNKIPNVEPTNLNKTFTEPKETDQKEKTSENKKEESTSSTKKDPSFPTKTTSQQTKSSTHNPNASQKTKEQPSFTTKTTTQPTQPSAPNANIPPSTKESPPSSTKNTFEHKQPFTDNPNVTQRKNKNNQQAKPTEPSFPHSENRYNIRVAYEIIQNTNTVESNDFTFELANPQSENLQPIIERNIRQSLCRQPNPNFFGLINMAIPIKDITDLIKEYKGDEKELNSFIKNIDKLWTHIRTYEEADKSRFMLVLQLKLIEKAADATKDTNFDNWPEVKKALKDNINPQKNIEKAELKLTTVKQLPNEEVETYAKRVEDLMENLNKSFDIEGNNDIIKKENDRKARKSFENGLSNPILKNKAISRGNKTLKDAVDYIIEQELRHTEQNPGPSNEKFCTFCKIKYHDISECRKRAQFRRPNPFPLTPPFTPAFTPPRTSNPRNSEVICYRCNMAGHYASDCRSNSRPNTPTDNNYGRRSNSPNTGYNRQTNNQPNTPPNNYNRQPNNNTNNQNNSNARNIRFYDTLNIPIEEAITLVETEDTQKN